MAAEAANFSIKTLEKYCNVRAKKCVSDFLAVGNAKKLLKEIDAVIKDLTMLLDISQTSERYSLIGSAYKRKSILSPGAAQKTKAFAHATYYYMKAHTSPNNRNPAYSLCNWLEMENILVLLGERKWSDESTIGKDSYKIYTAEHS